MNFVGGPRAERCRSRRILGVAGGQAAARTPAPSGQQVAHRLVPIDHITLLAIPKLRWFLGWLPRRLHQHRLRVHLLDLPVANRVRPFMRSLCYCLQMEGNLGTMISGATTLFNRIH